MMNKFWIYITFLIILSGCSALNNERIYEGSYENEKISIHFADSKKGKIFINNNSIPFTYEIEMNRINPKTEIIDKKKIKTYVYRFNVNAEYEFNFPLGFYEIGQKGGDVLHGSNGLTLLRKAN